MQKMSISIVKNKTLLFFEIWPKQFTTDATGAFSARETIAHWPSILLAHAHCICPLAMVNHSLKIHDITLLVHQCLLCTISLT